MDEQQVLPQSQETVTVSSFLSRAADVFSAPGSLYTEVAATPVKTTSWLIPLILSVLIGMGFTLALFGNATLREQMLESQHQRIQKAVTEGKMTQEQADRQIEMMESGSSIEVIIGIVGAAVSIAVIFFLGTLVLWLIAKLGLKFPGNYSKMLEVFGLSSLIGVLGSIVTLLMMYALDSFHATPAASLLVMNSFDPSSYLHKLLAQLNVFTIWQMLVLGIGISKISNKSNGTGVGIVMGIWILWVLVSSMLGFTMG